MNAKEFLGLKIRDFENGAVIDEVYLALKERDSFKEQIAAMKKELTGKTRDFEEAVVALTDEIEALRGGIR